MDQDHGYDRVDQLSLTVLHIILVWYGSSHDCSVSSKRDVNMNVLCGEEPNKSKLKKGFTVKVKLALLRPLYHLPRAS